MSIYPFDGNWNEDHGYGHVRNIKNAKGGGGKGKRDNHSE